MHQKRRSIWLGGTILLATCSSPAPERARDAAATAGLQDARAGAGGSTGTGGAARLGADAAVAAGGGAGASGGAGGGMGGSNPGGGAAVASGDAGQGTLACWPEGGPCNTATDFCCAGFSCASTSTEPGYHCKKDCTAHGECPSGCCAPLANTGISICLDPIYCPSIFCHKEEQDCLDTLTCCNGLACALFNTTTSQTSACKQICKQHADCTTGCCAPLGNTGTSVCLDPIYCPSSSCHKAEEACAGDLACCDGLLCVSFPTSPVSSACKATCKQNKDCATGCCALLGSGYPGACLDKSYCLTSS
jgi:hypothetical protein